MPFTRKKVSILMLKKLHVIQPRSHGMNIEYRKLHKSQIREFTHLSSR